MTKNYGFATLALASLISLPSNALAFNALTVPPIEANCSLGDIKTTEEIDSRLSVAGLKSRIEVKKFIERLLVAEKNNNQTELASMIHYPLRIYSTGVVVKTYRNQKSLIRDFQIIFTPKVRSSIRCARYESLFINYQGAMLGTGELWFNNFSGQLTISAINS